MASQYIGLPPGVPIIRTIAVSGPLSTTGGQNPVISIHQASTTTDGFLSAGDFNIFNNKLDAASGNFITNPSAASDTSSWNLYNNTGRTVPASVVISDLTYTAVASGATGNGINVDYVFFNSPPYSGVTVTVLSSTHITIKWYNGPTLSQNPTAAQIKTAWDAAPGAVALATVAITGVSSNLQYITGTHLLAGGGDVFPTTGTGGISSGLTLSRTLAYPLLAPTAFDLGKDAANREGQGVSTDFVIDGIDRGEPLQINILYESSSGMVLGSASDVQIFVYDKTNAALITVTPKTLAGPVSTIKEFVGTFTASASSIDYRLILHVATASTAAWDLIFSSVVLNAQVTPGVVTEVASLVLEDQPISGAVTDHMVVMWRDGSTQWVPATIAGAAIPAFGDDRTQLGFATNILGSIADIHIRGALGGFSFGPFVGYTQYIDNTAGSISPLPSPFTDTYVSCGMAVSSTVLNIQFDPHVSLVSTASGTPLKGGLLSNSAVNDGTGDQVLSVGANGNVLVANSAAALGLSWAPSVVAAAPFTYTTATRTLTIATATNAVAGVLSAADHTTYSGYAASIALLAPLASPVLTGNVTASTGNILISTIGKGLQVKTGANSKLGTAVLVTGTVTVANTSITANSLIFLTSQINGGTPGFLRIGAKTAGTNFTITSSSALDTSTVAWNIIESIP